MTFVWLTVWFWLCPFICGSPQLLFANRKDIRLIDGSKPRSNSSVIISHLEDATALDFYYDDHSVFWADISLEMIKRTYMNGSGTEINVITTGLTSPEGLACDWLSKKLYWTDAETNRIEVSNFDGSCRKVLFWDDMDQPRAIALAPMDGLMFWTDWGEVPKIERAAMDGNRSSRVVVVIQNVSWPNGVTIDYEAKRVYWADGRLHLISSIDYNGGSRKMVAEEGLEHPFALTIYQNIIYWTDWQTRSIHMCNQTGGGRKLLLTGQLSPMGIHAYAPERQPKKVTRCHDNNGGCSHLCLLSPNEPGFTCACPTGVKLKDKRTCHNGAQEMLLLARRTDLRRISLDTPDYTDVVLQVDGVKHAIAIDYDPVEGYVYWSDDEVRRIRRAYLDKSGQEDLIVNEVYHPDGVAVDWVAGNLYWTDTGTDRIEVARLNGTSRKVLINQGLDEPRAIVLDPVDGYMFWTDWGAAPKIERAALDGTDRVVIISVDLMWPNGLALDYDKRKVYFGDAKTDKIEYCNFDGTDRRQLVTDQLPHLFGFSLLGDFVYWTDWQRRSIERVHKKTGSQRQTIIEQLPDLMGLKAIRVNKSWGTNNCAVNNGGCSHLCLNRPNNNYVCSCPMGMELTADQKTCIVPEAFLLFARRHDIRRISLVTHHNNVAIPVSGIKEVITLDFDINDNRIYWTDLGQKSICRAFMNGSNLEYVVDFGLEYPEGMAVDWVARNIYWTDMGSNRIEMSRLDGSSRKVLIWKNISAPHTITLDPSHGYIYWSDWGPSPHIERAAMDGTRRHVLIKDSGRAVGLTIDYEDRRLYWINADLKIIESSDMQGNGRVKVIGDHLLEPYGLTQYHDYIYWTDLEANSIERANKRRGENRTKIEGQVEYVTDILVFHASRQSGWNPCSLNNGGCSHLCLASPSENNRSSFNHSCSCPTHYQLDADNRTCVAPRTFMLMSQKNQISRLAMDTEEAPDIILPIHQLKNVRGIDYDFVQKFIYWIDARTNSIRRGYENGSSVSVFIPNPNNAFVPHDIAVDAFSRQLYWTCENNNVINVTRLDMSPVGVVVGKSISDQEERPRALVLHPTKGLMFWVNSLKSPRIERAAMDGLKRVTLFSTNLEDVNALALDSGTDILYWSDAGLKRIESANIDGGNRRVLADSNQLQSVSIAVYGNYLYWIDRESTIMRMNKLTGANPERILGRFTHLTDLISVEHTKESALLKHPCYAKNGGCSHLCLAEHSGTVEPVSRCSCPAGQVLKEDYQTCGDPPTCGPDQFTCEKSSMRCIPNVWRCDGQPECEDKSDEMNCPNCGKNQFRCRNGECVDRVYVCDERDHCQDGSDEEDCCKSDEFMCHLTKQCIKSVLVCDDNKDCADGSDEKIPTCRADSYLRGGEGESRRTSFTIGVVVAIIVIVVGVVIVVIICRRRTLPYGNSEECTGMMLAMKPPTVSDVPNGGSSSAPTRTNCSGFQRSVGDGALVSNGGLPGGVATVSGTANSSIHSGNSGGGRSFGQPYDRSHLTGASSSSSTVTPYPQETLNPPPSPVTDKSQYSTYCCSSHASAPPPHSYRYYRIRNRPPPPTPCSTDVCDDSEPYPCNSDRYYTSRHDELSYESDPYPPPPTPRSHYLSDDNYGTSCPPSPSTERSFCNPYPPPPSPEGPSDC